MAKLAEQDPSNAGWQKSLAVSHSRVGGVYEAQGKLTEALGSFEKGLRIMAKLAEQDPSNAGWQRDLAQYYWSVGMAFAQLDKISEAASSVSATLRIYERIAEDGDPQWKEELESIRKIVGDLDGSESTG